MNIVLRNRLNNSSMYWHFLNTNVQHKSTVPSIFKRKKFLPLFSSIKSKVFKFFQEPRFTNSYEVYSKGIKLRPFLIAKSRRRIKIQKGFLKQTQQKHLDLPGIKQRIPSFKFRQFTNPLQINGVKIFTSIKKLSIKKLFQESANELKIFLDIELISKALQFNPLLGSCWVFFNKLSRKTSDFWFSYFSSCFNIMIRHQTNLEKAKFVDKIYRPNFLKTSRQKDFEFSSFTENSEFMRPRTEEDEESVTSFGIEGENLKKFLLKRKKNRGFSWRNRNFHQTTLNNVQKVTKRIPFYQHHIFVG